MIGVELLAACGEVALAATVTVTSLSRIEGHVHVGMGPVTDVSARLDEA